jgi:16S rRNA (guanine966-N2)-methyltransferase
LAKQYDLTAIKPFKSDVFKFLESDTEKYDLIFADPPYDLPQINIIASKIFDHNLLKPEGYLIIEHPSMKKLDNHPNYVEQRQVWFIFIQFFPGKVN